MGAKFMGKEKSFPVSITFLLRKPWEILGGKTVSFMLNYIWRILMKRDIVATEMLHFNTVYH